MLIIEVIIIFLISSHVKILGTCQCIQVEMVDKKSHLVEHLQFNSYIPIPIMLSKQEKFCCWPPGAPTLLSSILWPNRLLLVLG